MRDWWNDAGQTSTSTVGFITEEELASCAVTAAKMASGTITACQIASCAIEAAKLGALSVLSCKISDNALHRTVILPYPKLLTTWGANLSSAYVLYQPIVPINVQSFQLINMAAMENSTADGVVLFRNSSSCIGGAGWTSISTAVAAGTLSCVGTVTNALVTANTPITMKTNFSTCSVSAAGYVALQYISTG